MRVVVEKTHREAKVDAGSWIQVCGAQLEHVAETFGLAVLAANAVIMVCYPEGQMVKSASNKRPFFLFSSSSFFVWRAFQRDIYNRNFFLLNRKTHFPIKDNVKLTLSDTFCIVGIIRSRIQSAASGHLDLHR